ncbi:hypothetical protein [Croceicoccus bisphenolivorans]|uniref:hypothetical protein n=1 Tax=Croceicoccus bisphenolivorans TaxID=1783232 RepID=UPI00082BCA1A|nr:hypothetical protein [Croceicoccus bisphenolivorans]
MAAAPNGKFHEVGIDDLFFSTTDSKGVIEQANQVFVDMARTPREGLVGEPHNIIRHPDMPGGAFRIVWETIGAREPVCAYVLNLAGDGSSYWAFATITPLEGGYISVRARPCHAQTLDVVAQIYARVREIERKTMAEGGSAARAARVGQDAILEELRKLGYDSYAAFMQDVMPAEAAARASAGAKLPVRDGATGFQRILLDSSTDMDRRVSQLASDLGSADDLAADLDDRVSRTLDSLGALEQAVRSARAVVDAHEDDAPLVANAAPALEVQCHKVADTMRGVLAHVDQMCALRHALRFSVCMAQMQAETVCRFTAATIDGKEDAATSAAANDSLVRSLEAGIGAVRGSLMLDREKVGAMSEEIERAEADLRVTSLLLGRWRSLIEKYGLAEQMADALPMLDDALAKLSANLAGLHESAGRFNSSVVAFDADGLEQRLHDIQSQNAALA